MEPVAEAAPPPSTSTSTSSAGEIGELCSLAQKAWFGLLSFLAFFAVVILSTTDSDFLVGSKQTQIPIIGIAVPTERFFLLAPIVGTVLYAYMHLYCIKLWYAMRAADPSELQRCRPTSLIGDVAFYMKPEIHARGGHWTNLGTSAAALLIWAAHPALLVAAIARSQAAIRTSWLDTAGYPYLSRLLTTVEGVMVLCLAVSAAIGTASFMIARAIPEPFGSNRRLRMMPVAVIAAAALPLVAGHGLSLVRTTPVSLDRQNLVGVDPGWPLARERRDEFREDWCRTQGVPKALCGTVPARARNDTAQIAARRDSWCLQPKAADLLAGRSCTAFFAELDDDFRAEWNAARRAELGRFPELDLEGRQLQGATAIGTKFINARMERANLTGANLKSADFEGADLLGATLDAAWGQYATFDRANLTGTDLSGANLASANFEGADLIGTVLRGANLVDAHLVGADLRGADLTGANLTNARLGHALVDDADLSGAILVGADLADATGLRQHQLTDALGDSVTRLPAATPEEGDDRAPDRPLWVRSCWTEEVPPGVADVVAGLPATSLGTVLRANLEKRVCGRDEIVRTFEGAEPPAARSASPAAPSAAVSALDPADQKAMVFAATPMPRPTVVSAPGTP